MPVLSFDMPAESGASLCVSTCLLVRAPHVPLSWHEGAGGALVLHLECAEADVATLRHHVLTAHPAVMETSSGGGDRPAPTRRRRVMGRHRR